MKKNIVKINIEKCKACKLCINECPHGVLGQSDEINASGYHPAVVVDQDKNLLLHFLPIVARAVENLVKLSSDVFVLRVVMDCYAQRL